MFVTVTLLVLIAVIALVTLILTWRSIDRGPRMLFGVAAVITALAGVIEALTRLHG